MSIEENKKLVQRFLEEPWNKGNVTVFGECCSPDFLLSGTTQEEMKAYILEFRKVVPDFKLTIEDMIAEGDKVVTRWKWTGTNSGPTYNPSLGGWNPPTGKPFSYTGISINQVLNGKIVSDLYEGNWTDMLIRMGVNPTATP